MTINWPDALVAEIAAQRCVFFLGAGVSASASTSAGRRPKVWKTFIEDACSRVRTKANRDRIKRLVSERKLLLALQAIKHEIGEPDFQALLNSEFFDPAYRPSELHEVIQKIDSRIVITTNFDKIYENYCASFPSSYKIIHYYSGSLFDEIRSDNRLIIKAHGSVDDVHKMIFTRADYHQAKREHSSFYRLLEAIFLTNTVVFLGCGLDDPDVLLVLEDVRVVSASRKSHYVLIPKTVYDKYQIASWKETYNVEALTYNLPYENLIEELKALFARVEEVRSSAVISPH